MQIVSFLPNLRTESAQATTGYTWGKPVVVSNIIKVLIAAGFSEIQSELGLVEADVVAERWLVSDDQQFPSLVVDDETGQSQPFFELLEKFGDELLGSEHLAEFGPYLTCVMKQLDTNDEPSKGSLSVQVHPKPGHPTRPAKPEMWQGQGKIYLGWKHDVTVAELEQAYDAGTFEQLMNQIDLSPEKLVVVNGGTIHAIRYGSFTAEWSMAPGKDDISKGNLKDATVSPYDRTDGKQARPGKEAIQAAIQLLVESDGLRGQTEAELLTQAEELWQDNQGNRLSRLFTTPRVFVHELEIATSYTLNLEKVRRGIPMYVVSGAVTVTTADGIPKTFLAGSEFFVPFAATKVMITSLAGQVSVLNFWFAPFNSERSASATNS